MALPPAIAPAPPSNHRNDPAQESMREQSPSIRDQHFASAHSPASSRDYDPSLMQRSSSASPHDYSSLSQVDHTIGSAAGVMSTGADSGGDDSAVDGRKGYGKRELSTSKRAAQNRAAQRAFRQRKEGYIKKLEEQVREYALMNENYKALQAENYQLRDYIINLQSRLLESQGDYPQPPPNVDLPHPTRRQPLDRQDPPPSHANVVPRPSAMDYSAINQLRASAAQVGQELGAGVPSKHATEDQYGPDLTKRVKPDNDPSSKSAPTSAQEALQQGASSLAIEPRISNSSSPQTRDLTIGSVLNRNSQDGNTGRPVLST